MVKVSIILPVYNSEATIARCLDSLLNQTLREIEIICIDDGSCDRTADIITDYEKKDCRITIIHQQNQGQGAARNRGMTYARGTYFYFIDSDDYLNRSDALMLLYNRAEEKNVDLLFFEASVFYEKTDPLLKNLYPPYNYIRKKRYSQIYSGEELFYRFLKNADYFVSPCLFLVSKDILQRSRLQFPAGMLYEDNIFTTRLLLRAKHVTCYKASFYTRTINGLSLMTKKVAIQNIRGYLKCLSFVKEMVPLYQGSPKVLFGLYCLMRLYKRNIRKISCQLSRITPTWEGLLFDEEYLLLKEASPYSFKDKVLDFITTYKRNGFFNTVHRLFTKVLYKA